MHSTLSLRISPFLWSHEERVVELLELLAEHRAVEEVAFFTALTHAMLPLQTVRERAERIGELLPRFRAIGLRTGINHLSTLGHLDEDLAHALDEPWQRLVDEKGTASNACYCFRDERVQAYTRDCYRALAATDPDFIWVDDDLRLSSHPPLNCCCFCPLCLDSFARKTGRDWTREALVAAFDAGAPAERMALRTAWLETNRDYLTEMLRCIRQTVSETHPEMPLGFMTTSNPYSGPGYDEWAMALAIDSTGAEVKLRPGGGVYTDEHPDSVIYKANNSGRQLSGVPRTVTDIQYEHENFPYQTLKKSATIFIAEMAAAVGAGCTGTALNLMGVTPDPIGEYTPYFERISEAAPFLRQAAQSFGRSAPEGVGVPFGKNEFAVMGADRWFEASPWAGPGNVPDIAELWRIGLPCGCVPEGRQVTLLAGDHCLAFSNEELEAMLAGGVALDGAALGRLHERGLGHLTGFRIGGSRDKDTIELLTDHPLNGRFGGWSRDCRPSFWPEPGFLLHAQPGAQPLAQLADLARQPLGCTAGVFENALGGRVAVFGYYPWRMVSALAKSSQMKSVLRWLSRDTLPAYVDSYSKAALWCRRDEAGNPALMLLNASIDSVDITVGVRRGSAKQWYSELHLDGLQTIHPVARLDEQYDSVTVTEVGPWQARLLTVGA